MKKYYCSYTLDCSIEADSQEEAQKKAKEEMEELIIDGVIVAKFIKAEEV